MAVPPLEVQTAIEHGQNARGWILNGYAQVEYLLGDIIVKANEMVEYAAVQGRLPHRVEKRIAKVRELLVLEGYFSQHSEEIEWIIGAFEQSQETRHLLAHGFCSAYHTPDGDFGLEFRKWHRDGDADSEMIKMFRLVDLDYERDQFTHVAQRAVTLVSLIHHDLGLVGQ
ncbi:hypothetical protein [Qipengyuania aquimaris]|uniref:hypothetical protein n=1 Tax=Qipengyuania aquimaris TaxID=255984 RepID=UPI001CD37435|nr:hypothetical protein [Qipengyuania aquimaris]MCA0903748.1 hypothetical protein [Qipengyuania aquimaris]